LVTDELILGGLCSLARSTNVPDGWQSWKCLQLEARHFCYAFFVHSNTLLYRFEGLSPVSIVFSVYAHFDVNERLEKSTNKHVMIYRVRPN
jgi:hypothetical protein